MAPKPDQRLIAMEAKMVEFQKDLAEMKLTSEANMSNFERIERRIVEVAVEQQREKSSTPIVATTEPVHATPTFVQRSGKEIVREASTQGGNSPMVEYARENPSGMLLQQLGRPPDS
ncbi:unnamed protein product [Arabis nemorensis]|uniref:Uncharacterized protein n=1 Tax=Arabis nemorensis TaxID=586526 RepID=A0A565BU52_9BRAS|nr:unnamed protein product [Arabis nemorensis]